MQSVHAVSVVRELGPLPKPVTNEAAAAPELLAAADVPLKLRQEKRFNVQGKKKKVVDGPVIGLENPVDENKDDGYPLFLIAEQIEGRTDESLVASGDVELRKAGSLVYADNLTYRVLDDELEADGSVRLLQEGAEISGPHLKMRLSDQIGSMEKATYSFVGEAVNNFYDPKRKILRPSAAQLSTSGAPMMLNIPDGYELPTKVTPTRRIEANGEAERIDFEGENRINLISGKYSTCKPGSYDWYLSAPETRLDFDRKEGKAEHGTLWFKDVPILYSPVATFALSGQSRSGILHPFFSTSTRNGLDLTVPYYLYLAPNYDLTLFPRYLSKRGFQLGAEARYLDHNFEGRSRAEYMPYDQELGQERYSFWIEHRHNLGQGVTAKLNLAGVSDDYYWQDMSSRLMNTTQAQLPRQLSLDYTPAPWLQTNLQVLRYQTLQLDSSIKTPYFLEPQLNLSAYKADVFKTDLSAIGQYSRFVHVDGTKDQGDRLVFYPQVSLPIIHPAYHITPKLGLHVTQYALDRRNPATLGQADSISRVLPTFTLDSSMVFEREDQWFGRGYVQTLEPRLYYVNIPYRDQSQIPLFDTALADFNFAQIFSENRYAGYDRINDAKQLTAGVTTRFIDSASGAEQFKAMLGQRYYFRPQRVAITGETTRQANFSNLITAVNGLIAPKTYVDVAWEYNYRDAVSERFAAGVRYQPELAKVVSASYRFNRDSLTGSSTVDQIDIAGQWPMSSQWYAVGRYNYSLRDKRILEAIAGVEYNAGCWAFRLVGQRLAAIAGEPNDSIFIQLELNDLGSIGTNPIGLLRRSIPGYGKTNEMPELGSTLINTP